MCLPFDFISPVGCAKFTFFNILTVSCFKGCTFFLHAVRFTCFWFTCRFGSLLTEPDELNDFTFFGKDNVRFRGVLRCTFGFVVTFKLFTSIFYRHGSTMCSACSSVSLLRLVQPFPKVLKVFKPS